MFEDGTSSFGPLRHAHFHYNADDVNFLVEWGHGIFYGHESIVVLTTHSTQDYTVSSRLVADWLNSFPCKTLALYITKCCGGKGIFVIFLLTSLWVP